MNWDMAQEFMAQLRVAQGRYAEALELFAPILQDEHTPMLRTHELVAIARHETGDRFPEIAEFQEFQNFIATANVRNIPEVVKF